MFDNRSEIYVVILTENNFSSRFVLSQKCEKYAAKKDANLVFLQILRGDVESEFH